MWTSFKISTMSNMVTGSVFISQNTDNQIAKELLLYSNSIGERVSKIT